MNDIYVALLYEYYCFTSLLFFNQQRKCKYGWHTNDSRACCNASSLAKNSDVINLSPYCSYDGWVIGNWAPSIADTKTPNYFSRIIRLNSKIAIEIVHYRSALHLVTTKLALERFVTETYVVLSTKTMDSKSFAMGCLSDHAYVLTEAYRLSCHSSFSLFLFPEYN